MSESTEKSGTTAGQEGQGTFTIQKVYVKDISFEIPHAPQVFQEKWQPSVDMDISNLATRLDDSYYEVVLTVTVTVTCGDKTAYLAEIQQAGIFLIDGVPEDLLSRLTGTSCPNILFPFAREMISDLVTKGGFPQLLLAPVNFDALYQRQQKKGVRGEE